MIRFLIFSFFLLFSSMAQASEWVVERATANVSISADGSSWQRVQVGDAVPNAYWVRTGPRSRVLLAKGSERIMYRENTLAAISVSQPTGQKTRVTQRSGSVLLAVQKRRTQHTSVVTPHLAAVVKGTVFEVTVGGKESSVRVDRGRVEVSDDDESVTISVGQEARVDSASWSMEVRAATETAFTPGGAIGMERAKIRSNGRAGGNGAANGKAIGNAAGKVNGNGGGNGSGGGKGNGNGDGNGNGGGNGKGRN